MKCEADMTFRSIVLIALTFTGCGKKELPPVTDSDAIRREQERLKAPLPGGSDRPVGPNGQRTPR